MKQQPGKYWDRAWSLVDGCTRCSPGCGDETGGGCWAEAIGKRFHTWPEKVTPRFDRLETPLHVKKPTVWSIWNDWAHEDVPENFIYDIMDIVSQCPQHTFLALTKRPQNIHYKQFNNFPNWWPGVTICTQPEADEKIPLLLQTPAAVRWISLEPCLEDIKFGGFDGKIYRPWMDSHAWAPMINWVALGSETGPRARPMKYEWAESIITQCQAAGVPVWYKYGPGDNGYYGPAPVIMGRQWLQKPKGGI